MSGSTICLRSSRRRLFSGSFSGSDFTKANLKNANLSQGKFQNAKFIKANCTHTLFYGSKFLDVCYPNGGDPFTDKAQFNGSNLRFADFGDADILPSQLAKVKHFWRTRLPGPYSYSKLHPLFNVITGGKTLERPMGKFGTLIGAKCECGKDLSDSGSNSTENNLNDVERLKAFWINYDIHERKNFSRHIFGKLLYLFFEFERGYDRKENIIGKIINYINTFAN